MKEQRLQFFFNPEEHRGMRHLLKFMEELNNNGWEVIQIVQSKGRDITDECFLLCNRNK